MLRVLRSSEGPGPNFTETIASDHFLQRPREIRGGVHNLIGKRRAEHVSPNLHSCGEVVLLVRRGFLRRQGLRVKVDDRDAAGRVVGHVRGYFLADRRLHCGAHRRRVRKFSLPDAKIRRGTSYSFHREGIAA